MLTNHVDLAFFRLEDVVGRVFQRPDSCSVANCEDGRVVVDNLEVGKSERLRFPSSPRIEMTPICFYESYSWKRCSDGLPVVELSQKQEAGSYRVDFDLWHGDRCILSHVFSRRWCLHSS